MEHSLQSILARYPVRDGIFKLLFPTDLRALHEAHRGFISPDELERYSQYWYDDAGVSLVRREQLVSLQSSTTTLPRYFGRAVIDDLPIAVETWLNERDTTTRHFYRRLNIDGHASNGEITCMIEKAGGQDSAEVMRMMVCARLATHGGCKYEAWIVPQGIDRQRAVTAVLSELDLVLHYMYGRKSGGLFGPTSSNADSNPTEEQQATLNFALHAT